MRVTIYPVPDRLVRHPATKQPIPAEGLSVEFDSYWRRREADGDVTLTNPNAKGARTAPKVEKE